MDEIAACLIAASKRMIINLDKTKELTLCCPNASRHNLPQSLKDVEQVQTANCLRSCFSAVLVL